MATRTTVQPAVDVAVESPLWDALPDAEALALRAVAAALSGSGIKLRPGAEISLMLTDDATIRGINKQWREQDKPTNVLSFPAVAPGALAKAPFLGDVAIAYETVSREADAEGKRLSDHFTHLVVHGCLHLLGFDHIDESEAEAMEALEVTILADLGIADPYAEPTDPAQLASAAPNSDD